MELLRLKELLKEKNIAGKDLAETIGVSPNTISRIASGSSFPSGDLLMKIANELDIDIRDLFYSTKDNQGRPLFVEMEGKYIRIGEINLDLLDEGSVPGSDEKKI
jgi:transcriptional regulator with XRE-family HTH domain